MGKEKRKKIELLAPAGNKKSFYGAVHAGADAIYLGGEKFGARAYADNFSREDLIGCIRYGHIYGCKSYLTVNTLMKEQELEEMAQELLPLYEAGLDGVIVQDLGALQVIRQQFPELELHASTQMTITGPAGAGLLRQMGVTRVVPARELSLEELRRLKQESGLKVEVFVHGAMCYCYSGACLFSSFLGGRSGNRGRCAQPCRLAYGTDSPGASVHRKEYYPLSLKDMCTIEHLPELIESGLDSLKIEGRMKKPEYAAGVTAIYRKYIDRYLAHPDSPFWVDEQDLQALSRLYIRGQRQDGYYFKHNGREMVTLESPSYSGVDEAYLEWVRRQYIDQKKRTGIRIRAVFVCGEPARLQAEAGNCRVTVLGAMAEPAQNRPVLEEDIRKQLQKLGDTCFALEDLEIRTDGKCFYSLKEINALRREAVRRLEDQIIADRGLTVHREGAQEQPSYPVQKEKPSSPARQERIKGTLPRTGTDDDGPMACRKLRIHISTEEQLLYLAEQADAIRGGGRKQDGMPSIDRIYVESYLLSNKQSGIQRGGESEAACKKIRQAQIPLWIALPYILRSRDIGIMERALELYRQRRIQGFLVRNMEEYGWLEEYGCVQAGGLSPGISSLQDIRGDACPDSPGQAHQPHIQMDHTVYVWNSRSAAFWQKKGCGLTCALELNGRECDRLQEQISGSGEEPGQAGDGIFLEKLVYGRIPMMVTANCIARTAGKCLHGQCRRAEGLLTDRYQIRFPVEICCDVCMNVIYNSVPLSLHREWGRYKKNFKRLSFITESGPEMGRILKFFAECTQGGQSAPPYGDYTTGHEKKGVL